VPSLSLKVDVENRAYQGFSDPRLVDVYAFSPHAAAPIATIDVYVGGLPNERK
jgi:hypothetical protein